MRIGIDYTAAVWQGAGIGRYTRELIGATVRRGGEHEYVLFYAAGGLPANGLYLPDLQRLCAEQRAVRAVPIPLTPRRLTQLWQRLRLPLPVELFTGPLDLLHAPDFVLPPTRARTLLTVHDLSFLVYPEFAAPGMVRYLSTAVPRAIRRADALLADSQATRLDMQRLLGVDPRRVAVVYPGVGPQFCPLPASVCEAVRQRYQLPAQFLLFVSTLSPRKNLVRLLEAFASVIERPARADLQLVLAGQPGWLCDEIFATIARLGLAARVRQLDFVDDKDLPALYNLARVCVYPSLYEGFGLPALEALACGTPLLTADNSSLPEVAGDAAVLVRAEQTTAIATGIEQLLDDPALQARLREAGPVRARHFSWQQAAQQLLDCYQQHAVARPLAG